MFSCEVVLCDCEPGWSGDFCEENLDACADSPCFLGVACVDEDPPSLNSTCGPAQRGLWVMAGTARVGIGVVQFLRGCNIIVASFYIA